MKILEIMDEFPQESNYQLEYDATSGIGYTIDIIIPTKIKSQQGNFVINIAGIDDW